MFVSDSPNFYVKYLYFELHNALMHEIEKAKPHVMGSDRIKGVFTPSFLPACDSTTVLARQTPGLE